MSSSNCCFLTCILVSQEAAQVVWYAHLFQNFPVYCDPHSQSFGIVSKAEIDALLELFLFLMIQQMLPIRSLVPLPFLKPAWKFTVHVLLKPGLENFEHYFTSVWDECNCVVVWTFFGIAILYSLQPEMEKLYIVSKSKIGNWLWLRS